MPTSEFLSDPPLAAGRRRAWLDWVDPRSRVVAALGFCAVLAWAGKLITLGAGLAVALAAAWAAGLGPGNALRRLLPLELFMLLLLALLPWTTGKTALWQLGPLVYSREGLLLGTLIAIKGTGIMLAALAFLGTLSMVTLGHALAHLRVPDKLIHLLMFTVRYVDVLYQEYGRLSAAMKVRGFRPSPRFHTYRTYGHLVGMLLVRSLDRSERILAAMKCRGFVGRFYLLDHFAFSTADVWFALAWAAVLLGLVFAELA